jgi:hypothetical protein
MRTALLLLTIVSIAARVARADTPLRSLVVVVAKGSKVTNLSRADLKRAFDGDGLVVNGDRLVPFNYPAGTPERIAFDRVILQMSPDEVGRYWVDRKIVAKFPSAISYVPADQMTSEVVAVSIDGVLPTAAGYPIKVK